MTTNNEKTITAASKTVQTREPSASEGLFGFVGWLTTRDEQTKFSARDDATQAADLVDEYIRAQGWRQPRARWDALIVGMPTTRAPLAADIGPEVPSDTQQGDRPAESLVRATHPSGPTPAYSTPMSPLERDLAHALNKHGVDTELNASDRDIAVSVVAWLRQLRELPRMLRSDDHTITVNLHDPDLKWSREPFPGHDMLVDHKGAIMFGQWRVVDDDEASMGGWWRVHMPRGGAQSLTKWPQGCVFLRWQNEADELNAARAEAVRELLAIVHALVEATGVESPADLVEWTQNIVEYRLPPDVEDTRQPHLVRVGGRFGHDDGADTVAVLVYGDADVLSSYQQQLAELHHLGTAGAMLNAEATQRTLSDECRRLSGIVSQYHSAAAAIVGDGETLNDDRLIKKLRGMATPEVCDDPPVDGWLAVADIGADVVTAMLGDVGIVVTPDD